MESNYEQLVKALRLCQFGECGCGKCRYKELKGDWCTEDNHPEFFDCDDKLKLDAADAIEELEKGKAIANRKLDSALKKMPKCGKWIRIDKHTIQCPMCHRYLDIRGVNAGRGDANYCPNCGADMRAKMEVQE